MLNKSDQILLLNDVIAYMELKKKSPLDHSETMYDLYQNMTSYKLFATSYEVDATLRKVIADTKARKEDHDDADLDIRRLCNKIERDVVVGGDDDDNDDDDNDDDDGDDGDNGDDDNGDGDDGDNADGDDDNDDDGDNGDGDGDGDGGGGGGDDGGSGGYSGGGYGDDGDGYGGGGYGYGYGHGYGGYF
ncbi:hypothetical protein HanPI659440_Chr04g0178641 [Helianthus annuus]|nr:hypothetical protein HanPI659440_Chr04g0178641 [Helianthus annuus]